MAYGLISLEKRLKENIKYYSLENLYDLDEIQRLFCSLCEALGTELLLTERHGEKVVCVGDFSGFEPDVVSDPGRKIRVADRTVGHLYAKLNQQAARQTAEAVLDNVVELYCCLG